MYFDNTPFLFHVHVDWYTSKRKIGISLWKTPYVFVCYNGSELGKRIATRSTQTRRYKSSPYKAKTYYRNEVTGTTHMCHTIHQSQHIQRRPLFRYPYVGLYSKRQCSIDRYTRWKRIMLWIHKYRPLLSLTAWIESNTNNKKKYVAELRLPGHRVARMKALKSDAYEILCRNINNSIYVGLFVLLFLF